MTARTTSRTTSEVVANLLLHLAQYPADQEVRVGIASSGKRYGFVSAGDLCDLVEAGGKVLAGEVITAAEHQARSAGYHAEIDRLVADRNHLEAQLTEARRGLRVAQLAMLRHYGATEDEIREAMGA